ncbi:hypothetical protein BCR43DRAFT_173804 [Syncephalastrum racemosum]|uniref:Uncharacterized protein n=1 Tax=Syncephalastrum racemosum TaxID=13706 RepID=A0A1X2HPG1_SYNRA|nr:hypothetical protein BCR43DRAFT_173804 [Syncephalastrum racemosum]
MRKIIMQWCLRALSSTFVHHCMHHLFVYARDNGSGTYSRSFLIQRKDRTFFKGLFLYVTLIGSAHTNGCTMDHYIYKPGATIKFPEIERYSMRFHACIRGTPGSFHLVGS